MVRIGSFERLLGPATVSEWHHLAYVQSLGTASYYYDGKLVHESTSDPLPAAAEGGFWLGGLASGVNDEGTLLFNGWIDEVRYQSFNPLAAGAFNPTDFLIRSTPLPGDFNHNGVVDAADYVVWREHPAAYTRQPTITSGAARNFGQTGRWQRLGRRCECCRSRTCNVGTVDECGGWLVSPATPGSRVRSIKWLTRETCRQLTLGAGTF